MQWLRRHHALVAALGLAGTDVTVGIPGIAEGHLHAAAHLAVLGHALGYVLQRFDGQRAARLDVDAVSRRGRDTQGVSPCAFHSSEEPLRVSPIFPGGSQSSIQARRRGQPAAQE